MLWLLLFLSLVEPRVAMWRATPAGRRKPRTTGAAFSSCVARKTRWAVRENSRP